jgi:hypothetical protein
MQTISLEALDTVTGGTTPPVSATPIASGSGSSSDTALQALQGISSSLSDLAKNQNQGLFGGANGPLLMMTMAMALSRRTEVVVYGGRHGWGYHWGW